MQVKTLVTWFYHGLRLLVVVLGEGEFRRGFCAAELNSAGIKEPCKRMG